MFFFASVSNSTFRAAPSLSIIALNTLVILSPALGTSENLSHLVGITQVYLKLLLCLGQGLGCTEVFVVAASVLLSAE